MRENSDAFQTFLGVRSADLRRIAARTRGEHSADELASEAWLIAIEIGQKRGWSFDFGNEDDQDTLFAWMHNRFVKYANKVVRHAIKLDRNWDDEDSEQTGAALARLLTAPIESDPHTRQRLHEEQQDMFAVTRVSYSEAAAYVLLLIRVDWHADDLAVLLGIGLGALGRRLKASGLRARVQPSLFDGVDVMDPAFLPWRRRPLLPPRKNLHIVVPQISISF
ncbi:hypothetical protein [Piscinibacter sp.]|uniref:hypothetical protein n=1 Tax=Piscinibacter sp. TaxID=1903157 RepID=UPI002C40A0B1|nr:hypothetical protein [Albitalea sp.]HUG24151.1 hypothetical protein [Albitalea sp.]